MPPPQDPYGYQPQDGGYGGGDPEDPNKGFGFDDATIRRGFIRKVYSILMVSHSIYFGKRWTRFVDRNLINCVRGIIIIPKNSPPPSQR